MKPSLSVLLPVRNCQSTLGSTIHEILDILPELTDRFEIVVIDDGSTDATIEVADEFVMHYPQIMAIRHARPLGQIAAIRTGLKRTTGEVVLVREEACRSSADVLPRLWRSIVGGANPRPTRHDRSGRLHSGPEVVASGGFRMFVREAIEPPAPHARLVPGSPESEPSAASRPKRPNYLAKLRDFALGE